MKPRRCASSQMLWSWMPMSKSTDANRSCFRYTRTENVTAQPTMRDPEHDLGAATVAERRPVPGRSTCDLRLRPRGPVDRRLPCPWPCMLA